MSHKALKVEEVKLVYRNKLKADDRPILNQPEKVHEYLLDTWDMDQIALLEEFKLVMIDRRNRLMSIGSLSKGGTDATHVDIKLAFMMALKRKASAIILVHNHPSGNKNPSRADIRLTKKFVEAGRLLDIPVLDHIIVTEDSFYSMADEGVL